MTRTKGNPNTEEHNTAISEGMRKLWKKRKKQGYMTEERRQQISEAAKECWKKRKENQK